MDELLKDIRDYLYLIRAIGIGTIASYMGSKWLMAKNIIPLFGEHKIYVEPFGGVASVLMQKEKSETEVYNELDYFTYNML